MLILGAGAMSVGCGVEGSHEEPGLGEAGGPGVGGVHKAAFRPRPFHEPYRSFHLLITVVSQWESEAIKISKTFKIL